MKKMHHLKDCFWTPDDIVFMANLGFTVKEKEYSHFYLEENDLYKKLINRFSKRWDSLNDFVYFDYSKEDVFSADYCVIRPFGGGGYPQPERTREWISNTFDMSEFCCYCGTPLVQVADFKVNRISKRPMWSFTAWIYDVYFATEDFYKEVFEPLGIGYRTVHRAAKRLYEGIVQIDIPVIDEELDLSMHTEKEVCPECGKVKYGAMVHYPFFPQPEHPLPHIFRTKEYFGYGAEAFHRTIISTELAKELIKKKVINFDMLTPCKKNLSEYLKTIKY